MFLRYSRSYLKLIFPFRPSFNGKANFSSQSVEVKELRIPVPWGFIAGRLWTPSPKTSISPTQSVLCIHGWKDNAASFDALMPLLIPELKSYQFLCIDLPGHGFSSHYPPGFYYHFIDSFTWILRVMKHFEWDKINIIGHSLGGILGFVFSATHPSCVKNLVTIDSLTPVIFPVSDLMQMIPDITSHVLRMDEKIADTEKAPQTYSLEEAYKMILQSHMMGIHENGCKLLMTRGLREICEGSGRYIFSHDIRTQYLPITPFNHRQIGYMAKNFNSGLLQIKAEDGVNYMTTYMQTKIKYWLRKSNSHPVKFITIPKATHHVHLIQPKLIVVPIVHFMNKQN